MTDGPPSMGGVFRAYPGVVGTSDEPTTDPAVEFRAPLLTGCRARWQGRARCEVEGPHREHFSTVGLDERHGGEVRWNDAGQMLAFAVRVELTPILMPIPKMKPGYTRA